MQNKSAITNVVYLSPRFLGFLSLSYTVIVVLANWFNSVQINLYDINMRASILIYPITFQLLNIITEIYGYKHARRVIWCGFFFTMIFFIFAQATYHMPNPNYPTNNKIYDTLLITHFNDFIPLMIFYFASETFTSYLIAKSKILMKGQYQILRMILSSSFAICIGCSLNNFSIFFTKTNLISIPEVLIMLLIILTCSPLLKYLARKLISIEKLDIYDINTNFNLFKFDTTYTTINNNILQDEVAIGKI